MAKHFGSIMDFTRQRNDDIMRAYREQLALANYIIMPEIFKKVAESPARRFWVSEERAAVEVSRMLVGKPFSRMRTNKREMFKEIFRRYIALRDLHPDKSYLSILSLALSESLYIVLRMVGMTNCLTDIEKILTENDRRNEVMYASFDPITGEGSIGERVEVSISDFVMPVQWLPVGLMVSLPVVAC